MKKLAPQKILVMLLLSLLSLTSRALPFVPTTDPLSSTTKWYQIKNGDMYLCSGSDESIHASFSPSTDDNYQWCFVGTESTGYKVYSRAKHRYMIYGLYLFANTWGDEQAYNYVEVENENTFYIYCIDKGLIYYLVYTEDVLHASTDKSHSYTAEEVAVTPPPTITGDLTGDGLVDIADVNAVINMMLGKTSPTAAGEVTGDGKVDIADVNAVINIMLGKTTPTPPPTESIRPTLTAIGYYTPHNKLSDTGNEGYAKLVDGDRSTKWCVENSTGAWETIWIDFKSDVAIKPTSYILTTGNDTNIYPNRNPKKWKIYGRNSDSESWTELVYVTDGGGLAASNTTDYTFQLDGITKAYQYYRFEVIELPGRDSPTNPNYVFQLAELTLEGVPPVKSEQSLTVFGYNVPHNSISNFGDEGYAKLVDGDKDTKWCVVNNTGAWETIWIDLKSEVAFTPTSYILTTGNDTNTFPTRNPKNWKIYGRNSVSESWTELAHVTDGGGLAATNTTDYTFQFDGITKAYQYYRFEVIEIGGKDGYNYVFQLAELTLIGY